LDYRDEDIQALIWRRLFYLRDAGQDPLAEAFYDLAVDPTASRELARSHPMVSELLTVFERVTGSRGGSADQE
jgi:hypothetical protein